MTEEDRGATTRNGEYGETNPGAVGFTKTEMRTPINSQGRWPANLCLSYPEDEYLLKPTATAEQRRELYGWLSENA
jgi:hypothetical protein